MRDNIQTAVPSPRELILTDAEVKRRMLVLAELQAALAAQEIRSVLARNHRLVLEGSGTRCAPSGLTNPQLHIFGPDRTDIAATDGTTYTLASGPEYPTTDPAAAAIAIRHGQHAAQRA